MRYAIALAAATTLAAHAATLAPDEFAWRAPLDVPAGASLVRVELPASALLRLQSADGADVRVFNAAGEAVPFAWLASAAADKPAEEKAAAHRALPLFTTGASATQRPPGSVQVHVGGTQAVWVRVDGASAPGARPLDAVLFDTRGERKPLAAVDVQGSLPANTPVRLSAWTSTDLAQWTPAGVRGRLFRFDGEGAPSNLRLAFDAPLDLKDRYLRLDWSGQDGVRIESITGIVASAALAPRRVTAPLPALREAAPDAAELDTGFATPIAAIALTTPNDNTLVPVRVLGRNDASQPWRVLGQTVVYRLGSASEAMVNPPLELPGASVRHLRIVATNGAALAPARLAVQAEFAPRQLVFVASGSPPYRLAAGRDRTDAAALPAATLTGMLGARKPDELPLARVGEPTQSAPLSGDTGWLAQLTSKRAALWAVLLLAVALLAGAAWSLGRELQRKDANP